MAEQEGQEKTEAPTDKKRKEARDKGQVAFSREVTSASALAAAAMLFFFMGPSMLLDTRLFLSDAFSQLVVEELSIVSLKGIFDKVMSFVSPIFLPFAIASILIIVLSSLFQVGVRFTADPLQPKLNRISPLNGLKQLFSSQAIANLFKSLFKMTVMGYIAYLTFEEETIRLLGLSALAIEPIVNYNFSVVGIATGKIILALVALAAADLFYQRWFQEQKLKMTKQEVKEEQKQSEGDPLLRGRIRQTQRELSRARMIQEVSKADAVVVNPTHYAVAVLYDRETMLAPQVIAKGVDFLALRMRAVAEENTIPIVERPKVARELYNNVEIGEAVPTSLYKAVAEILAYVYGLRKK